MQPLRKADCPNCGGPIEFKLGSSLACICPYCRFSVVRTDQSLEAIGRVADLVPTAPLFSVGDSGSVEGQAFRVGGRLQLDHGQGPWDEWYVELDNGRWGWLAQAQGRFYLTHPIEGASTPGWDQVAPGTQIALPAAGGALLTVQERGGSALVSAEGELPFPAIPMSSGRYADLAGPGDIFATIDFGDGSEPAQLYVGRQIDNDRVELSGRALGPAPEQKAAADRLRCPTCGSPIEIRLPDSTERAACPSCASLLDFEHGALRYLKKLDQPALKPLIPLGTEGTIAGEQVLVIGYMERYTTVDHVQYSWREYLLHTRLGYRFLQEDNGHFVYMWPVSAGQVQDGYGSCVYDGTRFKAFQSGDATVRHVLGEFYWKVEAGERVDVRDFVAPPRVLSCEQTDRELTWTLGEYVAADTLWSGLGLPGSPPPQRGIAPCQPNPVRLGFMAMSFVSLLFLLGVVSMSVGPEVKPLFEEALQPQAEGSVPDESSITYSQPFDVAGGPTTLGIRLQTGASNSWVGVSSALVNEDNGEVRDFYVQAEEWHGPGWSEGDRETTEYLGRVKPGRYVMRFAAVWGGANPGMARGPAPAASVRVTQGERSSWACLFAGFLLLLPLLWAGVRKAGFEARRWKDSDMASSLLEEDNE